MSFLGGVVKDAGEALEKRGAKSIAESLPQWWRSFQGELNKSETGKALRGIIEKYEVNVKQVAQTIANEGINPHDAIKLAKDRIRPGYFGAKNEALIKAVQIARRERGAIHAQNIGDGLSVYFHDTGKIKWREASGLKSLSPYQPQSDIEHKMRNLMSYTFTGRIAIPHVGQILNSILENGTLNTIKSVYSEIKDPDKALEFTQMSGALFDESLYEWRSIANGENNNLFSKLFHQPGFHTIRKWQIVTSALAGKYSAIESAGRVLKNSNDRGAQIQLKHLGLNPEAIIEQGKLSEKDLLDAAYKSAHDTIFIKDTITKSFKQGPVEGMKTIGILATVFPAVGEFIRATESLATGHNPYGEDRKRNRINFTGNDAFDSYVDALSYTAGFGIFSSIMRSANRNAVAAYLAGPIVGFAGELFQDAFSLVTKGDTKPLGRTILRKVPVIGPAISNTLLPSSKGKKKKEGAGF